MQNTDFHKILVVGCGDIGKRVAQQHLKRGDLVWALSHRSDSQKQLNTMGIKSIAANLDDSHSLSLLDSTFDAIYYFAPPPSSGTVDTRMTNFLEGYLKNHICKRILYISTTGVYGDHNNQWIDESTALAPNADRSFRRLDAERQIQAFAILHEFDYIIFRVAGIYSLEKLPLDRLRNGFKILDPKLASASNRIHADDLCVACVNAMDKALSGEVFNVADGNPSTMSDYFIKIAHIFELPTPTLVDWEYAEKHFSAGMMSYLNESKKISNKKLIENLDFTLSYPTLDKGLAQCREQYNHEIH